MFAGQCAVRRSAAGTQGARSAESRFTRLWCLRNHVAVTAAAGRFAGQCVVLDEFLAPQELADLTRFTLEHEARFHGQRSGLSRRGWWRRQL